MQSGSNPGPGEQWTVSIYSMFTSCVNNSLYASTHVDALRLPIKLNYLLPVWSEIKYLFGDVFLDELYFLD